MASKPRKDGSLAGCAPTPYPKPAMPGLFNSLPEPTEAGAAAGRWAFQSVSPRLPSF